jgi:hypothetical protein
MTKKLLIVWSTAEVAVAEKLVLLYGSVIIERGYWDEAYLMVWGPSAKFSQKMNSCKKKSNICKPQV